MAESRRLRTQAERDTDGTTWRTGGIVPGEPAILLELSTPVTLDELAEIKDRLSQPGRPVYITAGLKITRRRWWHLVDYI